jgi:hypothetical protein
MARRSNPFERYEWEKPKAYVEIMKEYGMIPKDKP